MATGKGLPREREKRLTPSEQELAALSSIEVQLRTFVRRFSRPKEGHRPFRAALEHAVQHRTLLASALSGDKEAAKARRALNAADTVGE